MNDKHPMEFEYCPSCSGNLDTGWECNKCGRDWMPWAYPRWKYYRDRVLKWLRNITGSRP